MFERVESDMIFRFERCPQIVENRGGAKFFRGGAKFFRGGGGGLGLILLRWRLGVVAVGGLKIGEDDLIFNVLILAPKL